MICDEDPLRRRPRESTAKRKRQERCVRMARKMTEWPSKRRPLTKIRPSDGCKGDEVPLAVGPWYNFHEFGCHLGNVGLTDIPQITVKSMTIVPHGTPSQLAGDIPAMAHDLGPDLEQLLSQRSAANALLPPIRLTSPLGPGCVKTPAPRPISQQLSPEGNVDESSLR